MEEKLKERKWNIEKIIEESRNFWEKRGDFSPTFIFKENANLHFHIYSSKSVLCKLKELEGSNGNKRWLWVVKQLGLRATHRKIKYVGLNSCRWKWIVVNKSF